MKHRDMASASSHRIAWDFAHLCEIRFETICQAVRQLRPCQYMHSLITHRSIDINSQMNIKTSLGLHDARYKFTSYLLIHLG